MLGIHPEAQGMALMQSSLLEAAHCTLALTFKGVHRVQLLDIAAASTTGLMAERTFCCWCFPQIVQLFNVPYVHH